MVPITSGRFVNQLFTIWACVSMIHIVINKISFSKKFFLPTWSRVRKWPVRPSSINFLAMAGVLYPASATTVSISGNFSINLAYKSKKSDYRGDYHDLLCNPAPNRAYRRQPVLNKQRPPYVHLYETNHYYNLSWILYCF